MWIFTKPFLSLPGGLGDQRGEKHDSKKCNPWLFFRTVQGTGSRVQHRPPPCIPGDSCRYCTMKRFRMRPQNLGLRSLVNGFFAGTFIP